MRALESAAPGRLSAAIVRRCLFEKSQGPGHRRDRLYESIRRQIREFVPGRYHVLGTDGFGRSDTREKLRQFCEVDQRYVTLAALKALAGEGHISAAKVSEAIKKYGISPDRPNRITV